MLCEASGITVAIVDGRLNITHAESYAIRTDETSSNISIIWLSEFEKAVARIPKQIRKRITLVIPPSEEVFIKYLQVPDVTNNSLKEAFRFECEREFPGGADEWSWDIYQTKKQSDRAFGIAINRAFLERFVDILIRHGIKFLYICPEILLNAVAVAKCVDSSADSMLLCVKDLSSHAVCIGNDAEYFRTLPIAALHLNRTIADAQKISPQKAEEMQLEFLENQDNENRTLMTYYVKQFAQKLRQELKKSELFYCRTFRQNPTAKLYLTGRKSKLYALFKSEENAETVDLSDALALHIGENVKDDERKIICGNIGVFIGGAYCLANGVTNVLNLFSNDFSRQIEFQRKHLGWLLIFIAMTLMAMTWLKILKKDTLELETKKAALEAKLAETSVDITRFNALSSERNELYGFIKNAKLSLHSQWAWSELFGNLQAMIGALETAWVESLLWIDKKNGENDRINIVAKLLTVGGETKQAADEKIENFFSSVRNINCIDRVENITMAMQTPNILMFSFDAVLKEQSEIIVQ
jgi:Tfp pilus assembly PilM family ATPase